MSDFQTGFDYLADLEHDEVTNTGSYLASTRLAPEDMHRFVSGKLDLDLLVNVRDTIAANPDQHDQAYYEFDLDCGTTRCAAGWAIHLSGQEIFGDSTKHPWVNGANLLGLSPRMVDGHPFSVCYSHVETLRNFDVLISLAKVQEDQ